MPSKISARPFRLPPQHEPALAAFVKATGKSVHATLVDIVVERITQPGEVYPRKPPTKTTPRSKWDIGLQVGPTTPKYGQLLKGAKK